MSYDENAALFKRNCLEKNNEPFHGTSNFDALISISPSVVLRRNKKDEQEEAKMQRVLL